MAGVTGKTTGVGKDIIEYLQAVAEFFDCTFKVTSGLRDPKGQAQAMLDNWIQLKRGKVYKSSALSEPDRKKLDEDYRTAFEDKTAESKARKEAQADFLKVAATVKSMHNKGRAVDLATSSVPAKALKVIEMQMDLVDEGGRSDIYIMSRVPLPFRPLRTRTNKSGDLQRKPANELAKLPPLGDCTHPDGFAAGNSCCVRWAQ